MARHSGGRVRRRRSRGGGTPGRRPALPARRSGPRGPPSCPRRRSPTRGRRRPGSSAGAARSRTRRAAPPSVPPAPQVPHPQLQPLPVRPAGRGRVRDAGAGPVEAEEHLPGGVAGQLLRSRGAGGLGIERPDLGDAGEPRETTWPSRETEASDGDAEPRGERLRRARHPEVRADADAMEIRPSTVVPCAEEEVRPEPGAGRLHAPQRNAAAARSPPRVPRPPVRPTTPIRPASREPPALEEDGRPSGDQIGPMLPGMSGTPKSGWKGRGVPPSADTRNIGIRPVGRAAHVPREGDERPVGRVPREPPPSASRLERAAERRHDGEAAAPGPGAIHHP